MTEFVKKHWECVTLAGVWAIWLCVFPVEALVGLVIIAAVSALVSLFIKSVQSY